MTMRRRAPSAQERALSSLTWRVKKRLSRFHVRKPDPSVFVGLPLDVDPPGPLDPPWTPPVPLDPMYPPVPYLTKRFFDP